MIAFSRAVTGLKIAEQNLYVTSNNLSNVETDGYHRQRLNQYSFQSETRGGFPVGLGVDAESIDRLQDLLGLGHAEMVSLIEQAKRNPRQTKSATITRPTSAAARD